eukprot:CAMPEP_0174261400 /NCGR_PEP_ID=MMETSP0439-20130205/11407_1 /TAXON_ID=0 /ORGANISM="Stereomyxa ramosa, Strain Chinc5" /LENGTH=759 /DNA_ID=CAMNT_0015345871 /DNA_START=40 /DNA_END=2319 /DNA_ORIENTATION=+
MKEDTTIEVLRRCYHFKGDKIQDTIKNENLTALLITLAEEAGVKETGCERSVGNLLYEASSKFPESAQENRPFYCKAIASGEISSKIQSNEAYAYFKKIGNGAIDEANFRRSCGVGVEVTQEEIDAAIAEAFESNALQVNEKGYDVQMKLFGKLKGQLKWANAGLIKKALDAAFLEKFGPKPKRGKKPPKKPKGMEEKAEKTHLFELREDSFFFFPPTTNKQNDPKLLEDHLAATGGCVVTRFPPEPNGYLHIGHAKAMHVNFGFAKYNNGKCYLRFDDTNPEKETQEYIDSILDCVSWLGHTPYKVTYASDYFDELYNYAVELIKRGKAYVCHLSADQMKADREEGKKSGKPRASPYRDRPIEESLELFDGMKKGKFPEGSVSLRMKQDLDSPNPCLWDHVAYRIKYTPHPHAGDKWCIYPSYDFTHCICDSIENITHSLCSLEFEVRRESYNWLCDALGIYRPPQREYSRLNIEHTVLSKRKLITLVDKGIVAGWDDPRMPTLFGVRRRGFPPEAINNFCEKIGLTRTYNVQDYGLLEQCVRQYLEEHSNRIMVVLRPLRVTITNFPDNECKDIEVRNHPIYDDRGCHTVPLSKHVYIDEADFRVEDDPNYYRLAPGKEVRLKYAYNIKCTGYEADDNGKPTEIFAEIDFDNTTNPKGFIHWVSEVPGESPVSVELRLYSQLFLSKSPTEGKNYLDDLNPNSLEILHSYAPEYAKKLAVGDRVQFEREAYFVVDPDTTEDNIVFTKIVSLKEDKLKN